MILILQITLNGLLHSDDNCAFKVRYMKMSHYFDDDDKALIYFASMKFVSRQCIGMMQGFCC